VTGPDSELASPAADAVILEELRRALDRQWEEIQALTTRATGLLGFAGVMLGLAANLTVTNEPGQNPKLAAVSLLVVALLLFACVAWFGGRALGARLWRRDPEPSELWKHYRDAGEAVVRRRLILNILEAYAANGEKLSRRRADVTCAQRLLIAEVTFVLSAKLALPYLT
jgi:hypothetical protein